MRVQIDMGWRLDQLRAGGNLPALPRRGFVAGALACLAGGAGAQGFAGLGGAAQGFALPERGRELIFPADHGAHPDFRVEWWYLTANVRGAQGRDFGCQWTLFRSALEPGEAEGWQSPQLWLGHAGLTTPERHFSAERRGRGGIGQAGVRAEPFSAWIDEWQLRGAPEAAMEARAVGGDFAFTLALQARGPLVLHGDRGYSVKSPDGRASHYYSQPFLEAEGELHLPEGSVEVQGKAWMDREWSSQPLAPDQTGWDWISLHLETGEKLMGFRLRSAAGGVFTAATWITADGTPTPYPDGALVMTPTATARVAGRRVPVAWRVALPARGLDVALSAVFDGAWQAVTPPYWEGPVRVSGSHSGVGYLEMTGY